MKQYCLPHHLVTTYDGTCPPGFVEVGTSPIVAGGLQAMIGKQKDHIATLEARVKQLNDAIDQLFTLVQDKSQPLTSPENQALINAGDTISVNEGNLWNLRWVLVAHAPSPSQREAK